MLEIRKAGRDELEEVIKLSDYVFRESRGHQPSMGQQFPFMFSGDNLDSVYVAQIDGKIVSIIGTVLNDAIIYGHKVRMASMGSVCTHPDFWGRGIGTKLLEYTFDDLYAKKAGIVTISGTRGLYKRNKAVNQGNVYGFEIETAAIPETDKGRISYEYITESSIAGRLHRVYVNEPVRYSRTEKDFPVLFDARPMVAPNESNRFSALAARVGNVDLAYIIGYRQESAYKIVEYAGERSIIPALLKEIERFGYTSVSIDVPDYDETLISIMNYHDIKPKYEGEMPTTVRITNRAELLKQLTPVLMEVYGYSAEDVEELASMLQEDDGECAKALFDRNFKRDIFDAAIPLPWPNGLNYI